jgi:hypothetical protein
LIEDDPFPHVPPMSQFASIFGPPEKIGFTGSRDGMTDAQKHCFYMLLQEYRPQEVHHGDCMGADATFHQLVRERTSGIWIVGHPPIIDTHRAFCNVDEERDAKDYLIRDEQIVAETQMLWASPNGTKEEVRSGTWATVRYARDASKPIRIVWPDGSITEEN